jgi:four helix bundle protein
MDTNEFRFAHYKLHAWQVAHQLANHVQAVVERLPPSRAAIADQVLRAATGTEALIAEGAHRYTKRMKRQRFIEARGECGETANHLERLWHYREITSEELGEMLTLADRVCAMLTGLIHRHS